MADIDKGLPRNTRTEVKVPGAEEVEVKEEIKEQLPVEKRLERERKRKKLAYLNSLKDPEQDELLVAKTPYKLATVPFIDLDLKKIFGI